MTPDECDDFKKEILREIETHKINIYEFPDHDDEEENRFVQSLTYRGSNIKKENSEKKHGKIRIPNFCYIQVIVFDLSYLPVTAVGTLQVRNHEKI